MGLGGKSCWEDEAGAGGRCGGAWELEMQPTSSPKLGLCRVCADRGVEELTLSRVQSKRCHRPG